MALITDPDDLVKSSTGSTAVPTGNVHFDPANLTIELISSDASTNTWVGDAGGIAPTGNPLTEQDGVTLQALYSFIKEEWKDDAALVQYPFPMEAITSEQFEFINGWTLKDTNTASRTYIRTGGWAERTAASIVTREFAGIITLGNIEAGHQVYYAWDGSARRNNYTYTEQVNEAISIFERLEGSSDIVMNAGAAGSATITSTTTDLTITFKPGDTVVISGTTDDGTFTVDPSAALTATSVTLVEALSTGDPDTTGGTFVVDRRARTLNNFIRSAPEGTSGNVTGFTFGKATTVDIGATTVTNQVYRFPLSEDVDIKIDKLDDEISVAGTGTPDLSVYANMSILYYDATPQTRDLGDGNGAENYSVIIDANTNTPGTGDPTTQEIYNFIQYQLRQSADIDDQADAGDLNLFGEIRDPLARFVGDDLFTTRQSNNDGVYIDNFSGNFVNAVFFVNDSGNVRNFPFSTSITLQFNPNLVNDPASKYFLFYKDLGGGVAYGSATAKLVKADSITNVTGFVHQVDSSGTGNNGTTGDTTSNTTFDTGITGQTLNGFAGKILRITATAAGDEALEGSYFITSNTTGGVLTIDSTGKQFEVATSTADSITYQIYDKNEDSSGNGLFQFLFNYDADGADGDRTAGQASPTSENQVVFVCIGLDQAQYVSAENLLERINSKTFPITAPLERNYSDPL